MKTRMMKDQVFCLRNWALSPNSLRIRATASYNNGLPDESSELDLKNCITNVEGLTIIIENKAPNRIFIGTHDKSVVSFTIEIEGVGASVRNLQLEYAMVSAVEAGDGQNHSWEFTQLIFDKLLFYVEQDEFTVDMSITSIRTQAVSETIVGETKTYICTKEDLMGNIQADLIIANFFRDSTEGATLIRNLKALLENSESMTDGQVLSASLELEMLLKQLINSTQQDIRRYREALLEDNSIGG